MALRFELRRASTVFLIACLTANVPIGHLVAQKPGAADTASRTTPVLPRGDSIAVHLLDVDLRTAVQALAPYLDRPLIFGAVNAGRVTLESPRPIARKDVVQVVRGLVESQNLELVLDTATSTYRVRTPAPRAAPPAMQPPIATVSGGGAQELFVIRLRHARAADVAATVNALYGRASALGESSVIGARGAGPTLSQELNSTRSATANGAPPSPSSSGQGTLSSETAIVPDQATNALFVRGTQRDFDLVQAAVKELDVRPLQVLIQVMIAEVRRDSRFALGLGGSVPATRVTGGALGGTTVSGVMGGGAAPDSTIGDLVLRVIKGGSGVNFNATLTAAQSRGEARILSRPVLIAANNETAEILVGSQRPFIQTQRSLPTDVPVRDQVVQYKDVGTRLTVRPTISADGYVVLAVTQEVNQATTEVQFDAPVISTRTVQTQLLVRDSQTVVLGGLSDRERDNNRSGVPVLSQIPWLGALFGGTQRQTAETEFYLFITPRIIRSDAEADAVTAPLQERARPEER